MKRVLIFSLAYYPSHVSGAEVAIKEITDRIDPSSVEFHMITHRFDTVGPKVEQIGNVHVYRVGFGGAYLSKILFIPLAAIKARTLDRVLHFDALWSMMTYMIFPAVLARALSVPAPEIVTLQDGDPYEKVFERWFVCPLVWILDVGFRRAKVVQVISTYLAEWPAKRGYKGEVVMIPNGASIPSAMEYPEEELDSLRRAHDIRDDEIVLLTVARLVHQKAQDIVIRSLPLLSPNIRYLVVGDGPNRAMLENLAKELGVEDRVAFTGQVDRTMTAKYRKIAHVFVLPSRSEGQGISFLSTMVSGLPMVATQVGGIADFLFDAKKDPDKLTTGWAVDVDQPEEIANAVKDILAHPKEAERVAANAKELAHKKYSWDAIVKEMEEKVFLRAFTGE